MDAIEVWLMPLAIIVAYLLDLMFGDPIWLPHPIVYFGRMIAFIEKKLNHGSQRLLKGAIGSVFLILLVFFFFWFLMNFFFLVNKLLLTVFTSLFFFYGIANTTLIKEGLAVFNVLQHDGVEAGRKQLSRIVGRDTSQLSEQQIKKAALETMAENLSDGVVAPVFWFAVLGIPGMMAYKMINTLDSMIGYKNERYLYFGRVAAFIDDMANCIPARLTAVLMVLVTLSFKGLRFIFKYGNRHSSPNAGYPEAALAGILNVQFGGPNVYHGQLVDKPFIGKNERVLAMSDINRTVYVNHAVCLLCVVICVILKLVIR